MNTFAKLLVACENIHVINANALFLVEPDLLSKDNLIQENVHVILEC